MSQGSAAAPARSALRSPQQDRASRRRSSADLQAAIRAAYQLQSPPVSRPSRAASADASARASHPGCERARRLSTAPATARARPAPADAVAQANDDPSGLGRVLMKEHGEVALEDATWKASRVREVE